MAVNKSNRFVSLGEVEAHFCLMRNCKLHVLLLFINMSFYIGVKGQMTDLDSITSNYFKKYDIVFIGEHHNIRDKSEIEVKLLKLTLRDSYKMCIEQDYTWDIPNKIVYEMRDTSIYKLNAYKSEEHLYRFFYNNKISVQAINVIHAEYIFKDEILKLYYSKMQDSIVKKDIEAFKKIGKIRFPFINKNSEKYYDFMDSLRKHKQFHNIVLGDDTSKVYDFFDALDNGLYTYHDWSAPQSRVASTFRENFMLKMISKEIDKYSKVVSINGFFHVSIDGKEADVRNPKWIPLATLVKDKYPNKKICSIYLCKYGKDKFLEKYYRNASDYILNNCVNEKDYIIDLSNADNSFKDLKSKYTHIVVF